MPSINLRGGRALGQVPRRGRRFLQRSPEQGDIYLLRKVIHDWDDEQARAILRTCRSAMCEGSRLLLIEMVVPAGNTPAYAKLLDLLMLVYAGGRERTEAAYRHLLTSAGFSASRMLPTASAVSIIEAAPAEDAL
jgi:O-methyltransferase domain